MEVWLYMKNQKIIHKIINYIHSILRYTNDVDYAEFRNISFHQGITINLQHHY
jgi:uncharacterized protein with HEPN domain